MNINPALLAILLIISTNASSVPAQAYEGMMHFHFASNVRTRAAVPIQNPGSRPYKARSAGSNDSAMTAGQWVKGRLMTRKRATAVSAIASRPTNRVSRKFVPGSLLHSKDQLSAPAKLSSQ